jgi:hypothetical protein
LSSKVSLSVSSMCAAAVRPANATLAKSIRKNLLLFTMHFLTTQNLPYSSEDPTLLSQYDHSLRRRPIHLSQTLSPNSSIPALLTNSFAPSKRFLAYASFPYRCLAPNCLLQSFSPQTTTILTFSGNPLSTASTSHHNTTQLVMVSRAVRNVAVASHDDNY